MKLLLSLFLSLASAQPAPEVAPPQKKAPISAPITATDPGPFTCRIDPVFTVAPGAANELAIRLTVPDGTKVYQDMFQVEVLEGRGMTFADPELPTGKPYIDPWGGPDRTIYDKDLEARLSVTAPADMATGRTDIQLVVRWQGCTESICFMPAEQTFNVPVRVGVKR